MTARPERPARQPLSRSDTLLLSFVLLLVLAAAFLAVLFLVVRAAVEQGIRRALPDAALRPSVRVLLQREGGD